MELAAKAVEPVRPLAIVLASVADVERHVPEIAKHPVVMLKPTLEVEVASAEMFNPLSVVVPVLEISRAEIVVVEYVVGDAVAK